jgi:ribosomal silencing factor RsfS
MNIIEIQKYIEENGAIYLDVEHSCRCIDYTNIFLTASSEQTKEMIAKFAEELKEAGKDKKFLVIDSLNGGLKEV